MKLTPLEIDNIMNDINMYKILLNQTDYQATKHSEGLIPEEEYASIKAERQSWRDRINELEAQLAENE